MRSCRIHLNLTARQCERYYQGGVCSVLATSEEGVRLAFPAAQLRRFVTHEGVNGLFVISFSADYKLVSLTRLAA